MRTLATLFVALTLVAAGDAADKAPRPERTVAGLWLGVLKVGPVDLRIALDIRPAAGEKYSGKLISLDQGRAEVPLETFAPDGDKLSVNLPAIGAKYEGKLSAEGETISGEFSQAGNRTPLTLKRVERLPTLDRPQHPKKPYPYVEKEVRFRNAAAGIELAGTLTLPKGDGPFPAAALVTGSGPQDRDQTLFEHRPFLVIADHLTRRGIAVLRFDDRGVGNSGGAFAGSTTADFASDAHSAARHLASRPEIDPRRIGIIGHSEGAVAAQIVAAEHPDDVAFVVLLAGFGVSGEQLALAQCADVLRASGAGEEHVKLARDFMKALLPVAREPGGVEETRAKLTAAAAEFIRGLPDEATRKSLQGSEGFVANQLLDPWVRFFLNYDPQETLARVKCPVLALAGSRDIQVRSGENLKLIRAALRRGGNPSVAAVELDGLNHLFQACRTGRIEEYGMIEETFSEKALATMSEWVVKQVATSHGAAAGDKR